VIQAHKGKIKIKSKINQGTTVSLYLPSTTSTEEIS
jgi:chemotaxis protein histidine kinase CheA